MKPYFFLPFLFLLLAAVPAQAETLPCDTNVVVPKKFTPCGDGMNEIFRPEFRLVQPVEYHFWVYNRWGEILFETKKLEDAWTGTDRKNRRVESGQYTWKLEYRYPGDLLRGCTGVVAYIC